VTTRLIDMRLVHPQQDNSRVCSKCGERVGLYPSSQRRLRDSPGLRIICFVCAAYEAKPSDEITTAGSVEDIVQEARDSRALGEA
jgi:hypothetical protein